MALMEIRGPQLFDEWNLFQIVEWEGEAMPHGVLFPGIPAEEMRRASPAGRNGRLSETGMIVTSTQLFLLKNGSRAVLIEAGTGNGKTRPAEPYWDHQNLPYRETMAALGVGLEGCGIRVPVSFASGSRRPGDDLERRPLGADFPAGKIRAGPARVGVLE